MFSPLFTLCNHLPLDLVMTFGNNSPAGQAGPSKASELLLVPGKGQTAPPSTPELLITSKVDPGSGIAPEMAPKTPEPIHRNADTPEPLPTNDGVSRADPGILTPDSCSLEPLLIPGNGQTAILHSLSADTWYNLRFNTRSVVRYGCGDAEQLKLFFCLF